MELSTGTVYTGAVMLITLALALIHKTIFPVFAVTTSREQKDWLVLKLRLVRMIHFLME